MVTPRGFAEAVLPFGTTTILADPHEVAAVGGIEGVRWMIRDPLQLKQIVYVLQAPEDAVQGSQIELRGEVIANPDGRRSVTSIPSSGPLTIAPLHWADMDGNSVIDDLEILDVSDLVDESEQIHYDWDRIEELWDAGAYIYDESDRQFSPQPPPAAPQTP